MHDFVRDLRSGLRLLLKSPGFAAIAVSTLALAIGANTAVFSVLYAVLLAPLPYPVPGRLVLIWDTNLPLGRTHDKPAPGNFLDWRAMSQSFSGMAAFGSGSSTVEFEGRAETVVSAYYTRDFFRVAGISPLLGQLPAEQEVEAQAKVVVISHGYWRKRFSGDPQIIGKPILVQRQVHRIVAVMPEGFALPTYDTELWYATSVRNNSPRAQHYLQVIARLRPGIGIAQARSDMEGICARLAEQYPQSNRGWSVALVPLGEEVIGDSRRAVLVLAGAVVFVLLIACANLANLLLARASARGREMSVRVALGASAWRLLRQLLTESILLAFAGSVAGIGLAYAGLRWVVSALPGSIPRMTEAAIDLRVLGFTLVLTLIAALLFGVAPAWQGAQHGLATRGATTGRTRVAFRRALIASEAALALLLLAGAGLMFRSFLQLRGAETGFDPHGLLVLRVSLARSAYAEGEPIVNYYRQLLGRLRNLPGVAAAGATTGLPMSEAGINFDRPYNPAGETVKSDAESREADLRVVTPGYFEAMRIRLLRGRYFSDFDRGKSRRVVIINEALAREAYRGRDPVGKVLMVSFDGWNPHEIVGVVADTRYYGVRVDAKPEMFFPQAQYDYYGFMNVAIRVAGDLRPVTQAIRRELTALDPSTPMHSLVTMDELRAASLVRDRLFLILLGAFAGIAVLLAASGIYGVVSYATAQRTREFGIRMAVGARPSDVLSLVVRQGMAPVGVGLAAGLLGALALTRLMSELLFRVSPADSLTYCVAAGILSATALAACLLPARRATQIDPLEAVREE